jgi:hypothetical protein
MQLGTQFSSIATCQKVDRESGVIHGVSVITEGEASGHGLHIDSTTLKQMLETASAYPGGLKVKVNHGTGLESIAGVLKNFILDGSNLRGDLHILKASEDREKVLEMAETMPESFGVSVCFSNEPEIIEGKKFARCSEIYSADLVDSPAANPNGLFSSNTSKPNINNMSKAFAKALSLPETATEDEIAAAFTTTLATYETRLEALKPTDLSAVTAEITAAKTELSRLTKAAADAADAAKKTEISALVAEASRDGKVVPLTDVQLSKMEIADIKEMITKLPKAQVSLARKLVVPVDKDGKEIKLSTLKTKEAVEEFCRSKQEQGAAALTEMIRAQATHN